MSIGSAVYRLQYTADGSTTSFATPASDNNVAVYVTDTNGTETLKVVNVDYTVASGSVEFTTAPTNLYTVTIVIAEELIQDTTLTDGNAFSAQAIENALDDQVRKIKTVKEEAARALKVSVGSEDFDTEIASLGADKYLKVNATGDGFEAVTLLETAATTPANITGGTGVMVQTSASNYAARSIAGTANQVVVSNGSGVSGNPTLSLASDLAVTSSLSAGSDGLAGKLRLYGPTSSLANYVELVTPGPASAVTLTLPDTAGTAGYVLSTDGTGVLDWVVNASTTPTAGGSNTQIQYNSAGAFAGDSGFTTNGSGSVAIAGQLTVDNIRINGNDITSINTNGNVNITPAGSGIFAVTGTETVSGQLNVDNINVNGNIISTTNTNGDLQLVPNGTGKVYVGNLGVTANTASPALNQVLYCSSTSGNVISLGDNAATTSTYGQVQLYDTADGSTSTSTAVTQVLTPGGARYLTSAAQGWVRFNGTGVVAQIDSNYNITSITDNGTGDYTITFSNALAAGNEFCAQVTGSTTIGYYLSTSNNTTDIRINTKNDAGTLTDDPQVNVVVFGIR